MRSRSRAPARLPTDKDHLPISKRKGTRPRKERVTDDLVVTPKSARAPKPNPNPNPKAPKAVAESNQTSAGPREKSNASEHIFFIKAGADRLSFQIEQLKVATGSDAWRLKSDIEETRALVGSALRS